MGYAQEVMTGHGFRAMARTILGEAIGAQGARSEWPRLHRTAHLPARREMMQRWADYLDKLRMGAEVVALHAQD